MFQWRALGSEDLKYCLWTSLCLVSVYDTCVSRVPSVLMPNCSPGK